MSLINLLPEDYVQRRARKRANLLCITMFSAVMVGVLTAVAVSERGYSHTLAVCQRVDQQYAEAAKLIEQLQALEATRQKMLEKAARTMTLQERVLRSVLLAAVTNALPEGASLTKLELQTRRGTAVIGPKGKNKYEIEKGKSAVKEQAPRQVVLTVTGLAGTDMEVGRFIAIMARCPLIESPDLVYSQEKKVNEATVREFQVTMQVRQDDPKASEPKAGPGDGGQDSTALASGGEQP